MIVDDARHAFRLLPSQSYDAVVFGLLDSHTQLGLSSVRLDNYVFTLESFAEAAALVRPGGHVVVTAAVSKDWFHERFEAMMTAAVGGPVETLRRHQWTTFIATVTGDGQVSDPPPGIALPTDDWPFLYLPRRAVPAAYVIMIVVLSATSIGLLRWRGLERASLTGLHGHLFFLGSAFLLMEVHAINRLALLFGTTWLVSGVTIAVVLLLIVAANTTVVLIGNVPYALSYSALATSLALSWWLEPALVLGAGAVVQLGFALLLLSPVYFAGLVFARSYGVAPVAATAMGANILGSVLGGWIEYTTMMSGDPSAGAAGGGLLRGVLAPARLVAQHDSSKPGRGIRVADRRASTPITPSTVRQWDQGVWRMAMPSKARQPSRRHHGRLRRSSVCVGMLSVFVVLAATVVSAQEAPPGEQVDPIDIGGRERVEVRLVLVDVVVLDRQDRTVPDLTLDDFEVVVDGKRRPIDTLDLACNEGALDDVRMVSHPRKRSRSPSGSGRQIVLALDYLHLGHSQRAAVFDEAKRIVRYATAPDDAIMIAALTGGLRIEQGFTTDHERARDALHRMEYDISLWQRSYAHSNELPFFRGMDALMRVLEPVPGAKAVVLFSNNQGEGSEDDLLFAELAAAAASARCSVYPVFASGMQPP